MGATQNTLNDSANTKTQDNTQLEAIDLYYAHIANLTQSFIPIALGLIQVHKMPDVSLYLKSEDENPEHLQEANAIKSNESGFKIFRNKGLYISQVEIENLTNNNVKHLYIERSDVPVFTQYIELLLADLPSNSPIADEQKVILLRKSAVQVMSDVFANPSQQNLERSVKVVSGFVYTLMKDPKAYELLINLSSHDHYTLQHSVGVATNAIILAKKAGIQDETSLIEVGIGGLLHDIGKTKVPKEIINKKTALNESEWNIMKQHALFGHDLIKDNPYIGTRAKLAILQHHEDMNGAGYPMRLSGNQISLFARIVSICDIFNAITTDRSYSAARKPFEAFEFIKSKLFYKIDPVLFEALVLIYGGK